MDGTILITGGSGYFGCHLVKKLLAQGRRVRVFDLLDADDRPREVEFIRGDIRDYDAILRSCKGVTCVHHCVAQVPLARNRELFESVNIGGTTNLVRAAKEAGVGKVVILSSSAVFGIPRANPVSEITEPRPVEDYGRAKLEGENIARKFAADEGLDITVIRPRTILGHGRLGIFQLLFDWISAGKNVYLLGDGSNRYQFIHADDLAEACLLSAERPGSGTYHIGTDRFCTMRQSIEGLIAHARTGSRVRGLPEKPAALMMNVLSRLHLAPFAPYHWLMFGRELFFDTSLAERELNWKPRWGNIDMFCESYDWYVRNRAEIARQKSLSHHRSPVKEGVLKVLRWVS